MSENINGEMISNDLNLFVKSEQQKECDQLEQTIHKQNLIIEILRNIDVSSIPDIDEQNRKNITKSFHLVRASDYLGKRIERNPLGLSCKVPELSYLEKKALQKKIQGELSKKIGESLNYLQNIDKNVLNQKSIDGEIIELKEKLQNNMADIPAKHAELCTLLKQCVELKLNDDKKLYMEAMNMIAIIEQQKAETIEYLLASNYSQAADYVERAIKMIGEFIDEKIANNKGDTLAGTKVKK